MERTPSAGRRGAAAVAVLVLLAALILLVGLLRGAGAGAQQDSGVAAPAERSGGAVTPERKQPEIPAAAWILIDRRDGTELAGANETETRPIASTTKLMTAYLTLERLGLGETVTAPPYDPLPAESVLGLQTGEEMAVGDLLTAMMLPSANDAAFALADGVAGSVPKFVRQMNAAAAELGLDDTSYTTPIGLDDPGNGSSARDLATLAQELMKDKRFRGIVAQPTATLETGAMPRTVETRNTLQLADPRVNGIKTGHTLGAGYVLVASAEQKGVPLISVVLGTASESERDAASRTLLDFGFSLYKNREAVGRDESLGSVAVGDGDAETVALAAAKDLDVTSRADQELTYVLEAPAEVAAPIAAGERLGRARVELDGEPVGSVPAVAAVAVAEQSLIDELGGPVAVLLIALGLILLVVALVSVWRRRGPA